MRLLQRRVDRTSSDFEWARRMAANESWWKGSSYANKMVITDAVKKARKIDVDRLVAAIDHHFDFCLQSHRDEAGMTELAEAIVAEYEKLVDDLPVE